ncbi:hypothetical protein VPH35_122725 [Triticum aestivum]
MEVTRDTAQSGSGGLAALAASLASRLVDDNVDNNLVFSPLSIYAALALLAAGVRGATLDEILGVLGAPSHAALDEFLSHVVEDVLEDRAESGGPRVVFACSVWAVLTCPLKPAYHRAPASTYKADASTVDFCNNPEAARGQINVWVAQVTRKLIGSVLGPGSITPLTRAMLSNAMYFKGKWEKPFRKKRTADKLFHQLNGRVVGVPFMQSRSSQFIAVHDGFKVLKLRYQMAQAQPPSRTRGGFRVPKFKLSFHRSVVSIIKKLGLRLPFNDQVNLSVMAVIEVNEEGTEAAAVTLMDMEIGCSRIPSPPPRVDFVADHPFAYFIVEEATDAVVFVGYVLDPSAI